MGDRDALTRRVKFYTTATRLHNEAQGRFSAPWVHVRITHSQPQRGCTTKPRGALAHPGLCCSSPSAKPNPRPAPSASARQLVRVSRFRSSISDLRTPSFQLRNPRVLALWSTVIHHRFRLLPHRRCLCSLRSNVRLGCRTKRRACVPITITSTSTNFAVLIVLSFSGARTRNRRSCAAETLSLPAPTHPRRSTLRIGRRVGGSECLGIRVHARVVALWSTVIHHRFRLLPHRRCLCSLRSNVRLGCRTKRRACVPITSTSTSTNFAVLIVLSDSGARTRNRRSCAAETPSLPARS